ncbi:MAG: L-threonine 3-dehydrogenase [Bryobacterales bacterium]|nr:L-threonine 3-dehydrogenase [Bryobacterales bacterium]
MLALVKRERAPGMWLDDVPVPAPGRSDVLIRVLKTGICGTDVHIFSWDEWAQGRLKPPLVVGHEFVGRVEEAGEAVSGFQPGDIVSGEGHIGCGHCYYCRTGQGHICRKVEIIGVDRDGCFAQYLRMPESNVWKVRPGIPHEIAAIFDPLGNAMHTVMAQPVAGRSVAVVGAGAIGLMACRIAEAAGALSVVVVEPQAHKRALALRMGAHAAYDPAADGWFEKFIADTPDGVGVDVVLEISGAQQGIHKAFDMVRPGGEVALLGIPSRPVTLDLSNSIIFKSVTVRGVNGRLMYETWYQCERFLLEHKLDLSPVVTHRMPYGEYQEAFRLLRNGDAVKIILEWDA